MQNILTKTFAAVMLLSAPCIASAYVTLTFTGTATTGNAALGYTAGQSVSIVYTLNDYYPMSPNGTAATDNFYYWEEETLIDPELFSSVSGTGLSGTWNRPSYDSESPYSTITAGTGGRLQILASLDSGTAGITANGSPVSTISIDASFTSLSFDLSGTLRPDSTAYFLSYLGTYYADLGASGLISDETNSCNLTITSMTIASSTVPEPAACASIFGLSVLGCAAFIRRRKRAA